MKIDEGRIESMLSSKNRVKSKARRQRLTTGPKTLSAAIGQSIFGIMGFWFDEFGQNYATEVYMHLVFKGQMVRDSSRKEERP